MGKNIKLFAGAALVLLILVSVFFLLKSPGAPSGSENSSEGTPQPGNIEVRSKNGDGQVEVKDFNQNPVAKYKETTVIADKPDFSIVYFPGDQAFLITLLSQPLSDAREKAEREFLSVLQIDFGSACKLNVSESVPFAVDENLSGQSYALSFCPSGVKF